jgi:hypothetical protein
MAIAGVILSSVGLVLTIVRVVLQFAMVFSSPLWFR